MSLSRETTRASVGVCTRPKDNTSPRPDSRPAMVMALVAFMPMSQSACILARAASRSGAYFALSVMPSSAFCTERSSREANQMRDTGPL